MVERYSEIKSNRYILKTYVSLKCFLLSGGSQTQKSPVT